jgi:hypothetical protein
VAFQSAISGVVVPAAASVASATAIPIGSADKGVIMIPSGSLITQLGFFVQAVAGGDFLVLHNTSGAVTISVTAAKAFQLPADAIGANAIKIVANTFSSGTATESNIVVGLRNRPR